jgi:hypothetical protein
MKTAIIRINQLAKNTMEVLILMAISTIVILMVFFTFLHFSNYASLSRYSTPASIAHQLFGWPTKITAANGENGKNEKKGTLKIRATLLPNGFQNTAKMAYFKAVKKITTPLLTNNGALLVSTSMPNSENKN